MRSQKNNIKGKKHFFFRSLLVCNKFVFSSCKVWKTVAQKKGNNRHIRKEKSSWIYTYKHMKIKEKKCRRICSQFKKKQVDKQWKKKRTTIMMQLVRIWRLKESKERYVKIIWRQKKICTKDPEIKRKGIEFNLSVHLDKSDIELMSKEKKMMNLLFFLSIN